MIYLIISLGALLTGCGFIVNEQNAKHLLSGYNTLSAEAQANFDLATYIKFLKQFHVFLGLSLIVIGLGIYQIFGVDESMIFITIYPIVAYIYFIIKSRRWSSSQSASTNTMIGAGAMGAILIGLIGLFYYGMLENQLLINDQQIEITGIYGETIPMSEIQSIELVPSLPRLRSKTNGFALEHLKKGYFKTEDYQKIKVFMQHNENEVLLIRRGNDEILYFQPKTERASDLFYRMKKEAEPSIDFINQ